MFCCLAFGKTDLDQNNITFQEDVQTKETIVSVLSIEKEQVLIESTNAHQKLENHKKKLHLEWIGGVGVTEVKGFFYTSGH